MGNNKKYDEIVGGSFENLDTEEMENVQGAGDVDVETTPAILTAVATIASAAVSLKKC
ncbi:MAG: lichenicidin A2 family type 2 lantibiotic [Butyrivibrio sp.]|nr:lichenicidin A2 family type 2 lantibiotic [Butyrivibrio sp.]